jgi:hypothetical protein
MNKSTIITMATAVFLLLVLTLSAGASSSINISELSVTLDVIGGDHVTRDILIENTGGSSAMIFFNSTVSPDSDGLTIWYSYSSPLSIKAGSRIVLSLLINTSLSIVPGEYQVTTSFYSEGSQQRPRRIHTVWAETPEPEVNETEPDDEDPVDVVPHPVVPQPEKPKENTDGDNWFYYIIGIVVVLIVSGLLFIIVRKHKKK